MNALKGVIGAISSSLIVAILFAYIFRIPIPLGGYIGPFGELTNHNIAIIETIRMVFLSWVFYGLFGGFIVLSILGAGTSYIAGRRCRSSGRKNKQIFTWSSAAGVIPVFILSILDYIIGPW